MTIAPPGTVEVFVVTGEGVKRGRMTVERTRRAATRRDSPLGPRRSVALERFVDRMESGRKVTTTAWTPPRRIHPALVRPDRADAEQLLRAARARAAQAKLPKVRARSKSAAKAAPDGDAIEAAAIAIAEERGR